MQTSEYLSALGVVQYRRRVLRVVGQAEKVPEPEYSAPAEVVAPHKKAAVAEIRKVVPAASVSDQVEKASAIDAPVSALSTNAITFDLLVWKAPGLLVLDFSRAETELLNAKHRLANNVLKALSSSEFCGVEVYQHIWPLSVAQADTNSAEQWLAAMISGHLQQGDSMPIWIMGLPGLELLFPNVSVHTDLIGTECRHESFGVNFLITPTLAEMLENPVAKAQTWQLLKALRST